MRLVLARHGQTDANVTRALDSRPPGAPLNELGRTQAATLGARLAREAVSAVYASRATRAQQTAAPVAAAHGLDVQVLDGVQEVFCGDLEGRVDDASRARFDRAYADWCRGELDVRLPGGESALDLRARFLPAVEAVTSGARDTVVLVSHGAAIRLAAAALLGDTAETRYVANTGLVVLEPAPGSEPTVTGWTLRHWDDNPPVVGDVTGGADPGW